VREPTAPIYVAVRIQYERDHGSGRYPRSDTSEASNVKKASRKPDATFSQGGETAVAKLLVPAGQHLEHTVKVGSEAVRKAVRMVLAAFTAAMLSLLSAPDAVLSQSPAALTDDAEASSALATALNARQNRRPDVAETILGRLLRDFPNDPRVRYELGVTQALLGKCATAARTFSSAQELLPVPTLREAVDDAMARLCPALAPVEASLSLELLYDSNHNSGSGSDTISIGGIPFTLSDDAMAQATQGIRVNGAIGYNFALSQRLYLVPSLGMVATDMRGSTYDKLTINSALHLRHRGDRNDIRFGPVLGAEYDGDGGRSQSAGLSTDGRYAVSPTSLLTYGISVRNLFDEQNPLRDARIVAADIGINRLIAKGRRLLTFGLSASDYDYENDFQDITSYRISASVRGQLARKIGYDAGVGFALNESQIVNRLFGTARRDQVATLHGQMSFAQFETVVGRPYLGLAYTNSQSTYPTKDFDRLQLNIGFTKSF